MTSTFAEASKLWPRIKKYRKLVVAAVGSTVPLILFLLEPRSAAEIVAAAEGWILLNLGVYGVPNDS